MHHVIKHSHWPLLRALAFAIVILVALCSLAFGAVSISLQQLIHFFIGQAEPQSEMILFHLRLPRVLLSVCVGAMLACCGAVTQGLFRNPLADPSIIGISAGASGGASLVIVLLAHSQWSILGLSLVSIGAFVGGILSAIFVYRIATGPNGTSVATMLLSGIAVTFFVGGLSNILEFISDDEMLRRIALWRMGGLDGADYPRLWIAAVVAITILVTLPFYYSALNAFLLGESEARHLGIDVSKMKKRLIIIVAAGVGISVALVGTIAFVGLIVPHLVRLMVGPNHRFLIPLSAALGASLLVVADTLARTVLAPTELPVGVVTSIIGAPVFISLLRKRHEYGMQP